MTRQRDIAEDIVQETFARVVRRMERYDPRGRDLQWLFTIVRRLLLDRQRTLARRPAEPLDHAERAGEAQQELSIALREALDTLQEVEREAFLLREVGGLTYQEIATVTHSTVDSVRSRIYRARVQLREALSTGI
jgi:RNA polymerase sigma-70 factor, ECF subfamily